jgi:hypothetical protein
VYGADVQPPSDLLGGQVVQHQKQDLPLALGEAVSQHQQQRHLRPLGRLDGDDHLAIGRRRPERRAVDDPLVSRCASPSSIASLHGPSLNLGGRSLHALDSSVACAYPRYAQRSGPPSRAPPPQETATATAVTALSRLRWMAIFTSQIGESSPQRIAPGSTTSIALQVLIPLPPRDSDRAQPGAGGPIVRPSANQSRRSSRRLRQVVRAPAHSGPLDQFAGR